MKQENYSKGVFLNIASQDKKDWKKRVDFIDSLPQVDHVEIWPEQSLNFSELKLLKSLLASYKIIIHAPFVHLSLVSLHPEVIETTIKSYLRVMQIAKVLGAELVTFHAGTHLRFTPEKTVIKLLAKNLNRFKNSYKGKVRFAVENMPPDAVGGAQSHYPRSLKDLAHLKKLLPWLNFTLDIGHAFQGNEGQKEISRFIKRYKTSILDIHLHDAKLKGKAHMSLGEGDLSVGLLFQLLEEIDYVGYVSLETITREDTKKSWIKISQL